jgi:hypothetical protein
VRFGEHAAGNAFSRFRRRTAVRLARRAEAQPVRHDPVDDDFLFRER